MTNAQDSWLRTALGLQEGDSPFPWQADLLSRFVRGEIPPALDIPTGLGKTAVMAIWLVARSCGATLPRRLVYVVDRRAVVDHATAEAERLRDWVEMNPTVKQALGLPSPLPISTLRGQHVDNRHWLATPDWPAIIVGTVDMVGSRLLFEGYRTSPKMRPYHAALLGADALIVLDEAHLVPAFEAMARVAVGDEALRAHPTNEHRGVVPKSHLMTLSATGRGTGTAFSLEASDLAHEIVKQRLNAVKRLHIAEPVEAEELADALAERAWELASGGTRASRVIVFTDSRKTVQVVDEALRKLAKGDKTMPRREIETVLFVGGRRVAEREDAAKQLSTLGVTAGSKSTIDKPVFVSATSAGEVGVDLDADHAVLDLVEWERIVQRLGRVNRRGAGEADVWIVPTLADNKTLEALEKNAKLHKDSDSSTDDPSEEDHDRASDEDEKPPKKLKEEERARVERWKRREATLRAIRCLPSTKGTFDASPKALTDLKREHRDLVEEASTPPPLYPALTRAVVQAWSMTSLAEHTGRPEVRPWLRGWDEEDPQTAIAWRTWLPRKNDAKEFFEAAPVETAEVLETETVLAFDWLVKRVKAALKAHEDARRSANIGETAEKEDDADASAASTRPLLESDDVVMFVLDDHSDWTLRELAESGRDELLRLLAGQTIVLDAQIGGLDQGLLEPKSDEATDVSETEALSFRVREVRDVDAISWSNDWRVEDTFVSKTDSEGEPVAWLVVETDKRQQSTTAEGRSTGHEQRLDAHQSSVERHARRIADRLALAPRYAELLALAAVLHDEGKKADRWQRAFGAPKVKRPLAKTTSRPIQAILSGYRHEFGSLSYAERDARVLALSNDNRDLVLHLIAAHHGFARPILRTDGAEDGPPSALVDRARTIALRFARLERRWGPWGLAWWETLLRAADQGASRENDQGGAKDG